jgi:hypothetical protein
MSPKEELTMQQTMNETPVEEEPEAAMPSRPWGTTNVILVVAIVVGLVAATVFVVLALGARSDATDTRHHTGMLRHRTLVLQGRASSAEQRRERITKLAEAAQAHVMELGTALGDTSSAENAYADAANRAVDIFNSGDTGGAAAAFARDGQATLDEMAARVAAADQALAATRAALQQLEEELR